MSTTIRVSSDAMAVFTRITELPFNSPAAYQLPGGDWVINIGEDIEPQRLRGESNDDLLVRLLAENFGLDPVLGTMHELLGHSANPAENYALAA